MRCARDKGNSDVLQTEEQRVDGGETLNNDLDGKRTGVIEEYGEHVEGLCSNCMRCVNLRCEPSGKGVRTLCAGFEGERGGSKTVMK